MGKSFPPNPMLIHIIQDKLSELKGESIIETALKNAAYKDIAGAIVLAFGLITDNPRMAKEILGAKLIDLINQYIDEHPEVIEPQNGAYTE